ncbi:FAD-binding oxidoreductase [Alteromonas sp. D210916BOD_24]|uniref:NAD(P)/FAD-dependent oxidoreductase n=1 Tax=Alteromonas sp. D210916BOD_24 TaxID=3157618 RepID=UPI00399D3907
MYDPLISQRVMPNLSLPKSYWHGTYQCQSPSSLTHNITTEYLIVGGGYTGLSAAMTLAEAGKAPVLIDANALGFGCAGRNGGFILSGSGRMSLNAIEAKWGCDIADSMKKEFDGAVNLLKSRIQQYDMQVDLADGPYFKLAHTAKQAGVLHSNATALATRFKDPSTLLSKQEIENKFAIKGVFGGVEVKGACLHPLKLADEYARVAQMLGATLYYHTPALNIEKHPSGFVVTTPTGVINAKHVLLASNAYTPKHFNKLVDNKQFPVQSSIFVTSPMSEQQKNATGLNGPMSFMDTRMMKYYYRVLPDGRLLFGGRGAVTGQHADKPQERQRLYRAMLKSFPALEGITMDYFWSGWVSVSLDNMPRIFVEEKQNNASRMGYAMGYCGSGVSFAAFAGMRLAQRMLDDSEINLSLPLYQSPLPSYPFASFRRLALRGLYQWAKVAER